jgi:hypothetical protein
MELKTFQLEVRTSDWTKPPLRTLTMDDQVYSVLGASKSGFGEINSLTHLSYFVKLLIEDSEGNQYLLDTRDNCPIPITKGSEDELFGKQYERWIPGLRFYLDRLRTCLVLSTSLRWDTNGKYYIVK